MNSVDPRIDAILEVLLACARQDFTQRAPIGHARDSIDALAAGLNMLAEELHGEVVSRQELELAYRSMKEAQARLVHGGKLVAIGQLASGVAHEINNPASWLLGSISLLTRDLEVARREQEGTPSGAELRARALATLDSVEAWLRDASSAVERIVAVTRDLRTFARADSDEEELVRVADLVRAACALARPLLQRHATVELVLDDGATVIGSRGRLGQVLTNLLVNAAHAVTAPGPRRGEIGIEASVRGEVVVLAVDDSGPGVPLENRERVFEPFFTTKGQEEGTGLGLSLVAEIVRGHRGQVRVLDSKLGGARFEVTLPYAARSASRSLPPSPVALSRRPRLLLIDDEPRLLQTMALVLREAAEVRLASNGHDALRLLDEDRGFDAIVCDLQMPELDGPAFYELVRARCPTLSARILFTTGGIFRRSVREFLDRTPVPVLEKPVREAELFAAVARLMARS